MARKLRSTATKMGLQLDEGAVRETVGYNLKRAYMVLQPLAQSGLSKHGLRVPSFTALSVIIQNPDIAPSVLAELLRMERSNIVVVIDELETLDLVSRTQSTTDRRRIALSATLLGTQLHKKAQASIQEAENKILHLLSAEEQTKLVELLGKIEAAALD